MKKKILIVGLITAMTLNLCACGKDDKAQEDTSTEVASTDSPVSEDQPDAAKVPELEKPVVTVESLIQNHRDNVKSASGTMNLIMDIKCEIDETELEDYDEDYLEDGLLSVLSIEADIQTESDEKATHSVGTMGMNMFGFDYQMPMESYTDLVNYKNYNYNAYEDVDENGEAVEVSEWTVSDMDADEVSDITQSTLSNLANAVLTETEDQYVISGKISVSDMGVDMLEDVAGSDNFDTSCMCDTEYTFDKETQFLTSYKYDLSAAYDTEDYENAVCVFIISGTMYDHNATTVTIPEDVIANAVVDTDSFDFDEYDIEIEDPIATTVFDAEYLSYDDLIDTWLYRYPMIGEDYEVGDDSTIDAVIRSVSEYVNLYSDSELVDEWQYATSTLNKYEITALLLIGDLYDMSDEYEDALMNCLSSEEYSQVVADGYELYVELCAVE